jgi:hypothetical protein
LRERTTARPFIVTMNLLPDLFLKEIVARLDNENTIGIMLSGSFARGQGGPYSDVDIWQYVREIPANENEHLCLRIVDGYMVAIKLTTLAKEHAGLQNPEQAIWVIPGLRQAGILLDQDGSLAVLQETAARATWAQLQNAANIYASSMLATTAEEVHKILDGLVQRNESKAFYATWGLTRGLANALLVQRGTLIYTENAYIDLAQDTAGRTSEWTHQFRLSTGLDRLPQAELAYIGYAIASLRLYCETARLMQKILRSEDVIVVNRTMETIVEAGF